MTQHFNLMVPNSNASITAGTGPVLGISATTDDDQFHHAGGQLVLESGEDMRHVSTGVLAEAASNGIYIGTPGTIQAAAGGGVQIYAGASVTVAIGSADGPGPPFEAPTPATVNAGNVADRLNRFNDGVKGVSDVVGGALDMASAENNYERAKAAFDMMKGAWDTTKSTNAHLNEDGSTAGWAGVVDGTVTAGEFVFGFGDTATGADGASRIASGTGVLGKALGKLVPSAAPMSGEAIAEATAAQAAIANAGVPAGGIAGPSDGPRIHEVAPANIDRECGANMTAKVAGDKTTAVDGKIEYTSGASITMKAFTKVETQSLFFEAHANIKAVMKGLAAATVESLGKATLDGKASVTVTSMAKAKISAPKITIDGKASVDVKSARITIGEGQLTVNSPTTITKIANLQKIVKVGGNFYLEKNANIKGKVDVKETVMANGEIKGKAGIKNPYFKAG